MKKVILVVFPNQKFLETCYCNFFLLRPPDVEYFSFKFTANSFVDCSSVSVCSVKCFLKHFSFICKVNRAFFLTCAFILLRF